MCESERELAVGQLRCHRRLGSQATYRVLSWDEELVEVEVVLVPGLRAGQVFSFAREAVALMTVVDEGASGG
jgi:hypothetical protein